VIKLNKKYISNKMPNINELIFDIKVYIASFHSLTWYNLTRIDDEFRDYSRTKEGMNMFVKLFYMWETRHNVKIRVGKWYERYIDTIKLGTLFGVVNSINDEPAEIIIEEIEQLPYITKRWYKNGLKHRDDYDGQSDMPAEVEYYKSREHKQWYKNGLIHRDGDLPAIISFNGKTRNWLKNGIACRDNDLPACILNDQIYFWYVNGVKVVKMIYRQPFTKMNVVKLLVKNGIKMEKFIATATYPQLFGQMELNNGGKMVKDIEIMTYQQL